MKDDQQQRLDAASALERAGLWEEAARGFDAVYRSAIEQQDHPILMEALARLAYCHSRAGDFDTAQDEFALVLELAEIQNAPSMRGRALNGIGDMARLSGNVVEAERLFRQAYRCGEESGDPVLLGNAAQNLGILANIRGDLEEARETSD